MDDEFFDHKEPSPAKDAAENKSTFAKKAESFKVPRDEDIEETQYRKTTLGPRQETEEEDKKIYEKA